MKKLLMIATGIILAIGLNSCEKKGGIPNNIDKEDWGTMKAQSIDLESLPMDSYPITAVQPEVIPPAGKDRGGNRTCYDVSVWQGLEGDDALCDDCCGTKVDIGDEQTGTIPGFGGIEVIIDDDGYVHFDVLGTGCKVIAAIIKGSNNANVYWYGPEGIASDDGLAPPPFDLAELDEPTDEEIAALKYPWVSNITLCCVCGEKEWPDTDFAAKVWYYTGTDCEKEDYALSIGTIMPYDADELDDIFDGSWCEFLGFSEYIQTTTPVELENGVGQITVNAAGDITITLNDGYYLYSTSLFNGDTDDLDLTECPDYVGDPAWNYRMLCADSGPVSSTTYDASLFFAEEE